MPRKFAPPIGGSWHLAKGVDGELHVDLFVNNGGPRDNWVALIPLSWIADERTVQNLRKLYSKMCGG